MSRARQQQESSPHEARAAWFAASYELLGLAVNGQPLPELLPGVLAGGGANKGRSVRLRRSTEFFSRICFLGGSFYVGALVWVHMSAA
jgi:hypothetical protein